MWLFDKIEGVIVYITPDGKEDSFVTNRNQKMFEEVVRRTKIFHDLLEKNNADPKAKPPIIEPSLDCLDCQYYERCYIKKKTGRTITIGSLLNQFWQGRYDLMYYYVNFEKNFRTSNFLDFGNVVNPVNNSF